jgi:hypothetical protein
VIRVQRVGWVVGTSAGAGKDAGAGACTGAGTVSLLLLMFEDMAEDYIG